MKDFVIHDFESFLEIADSLKTPFKFIEVDEVENGIKLEAKVWLRSAYITYREVIKNKEDPYNDKRLLELENKLVNHGFVYASIEETPLVVR